MNQAPLNQPFTDFGHTPMDDSDDILLIPLPIEDYQFIGVGVGDVPIVLLSEETEEPTEPGVHKRIYVDGSHYKGSFTDNVRNGHGECVFPEVGKYIGQWNNDMRSGPGVMKWEDGGMYTGNWVGDSEHGQGTMKYPNGDVYIGQWNRGLKHGRGLFTFKVTSDKPVRMLKYDGDWVNDKQDGFGRVIWSNGSVEESRWENGKKLNPRKRSC